MMCWESATFVREGVLVFEESIILPSSRNSGLLKNKS